MSGHFVKIGVWMIIAPSAVYFLHSCYAEKQDIMISQVSQPKNWTYDITSVPLGERMYYVLIDGELNNDAELELQTQRTTSNSYLNKPDTTYTTLNAMRLPKGKFSVYYNRDDSGPEMFVYRPLKTTKGWVRVQISPGSWSNKDSLRNDPVFKSLKSYPVLISVANVTNKFVFYP